MRLGVHDRGEDRVRRSEILRVLCAFVGLALASVMRRTVLPARPLVPAAYLGDSRYGVAGHPACRIAGRLRQPVCRRHRTGARR